MFYVVNEDENDDDVDCWYDAGLIYDESVWFY